MFFSIAVSLAVMVGAGIYVNSNGLKAYPNDDVSVYMKRFDALKKTLPGEGTVGYLAEPGLETGERDKRLFLTQHALIPVLVVYSKDFKVVVGNFKTSMAGRDIAKLNKLKVIKDFGNGTMLLRNEAV